MGLAGERPNWGDPAGEGSGRGGLAGERSDRGGLAGEVSCRPGPAGENWPGRPGWGELLSHTPALVAHASACV
jgi:hypothetical protein